jgi:hypothetical protein
MGIWSSGMILALGSHIFAHDARSVSPRVGRAARRAIRRANGAAACTRSGHGSVCGARRSRRRNAVTQAACMALMRDARLLGSGRLAVVLRREATWQ